MAFVKACAGKPAIIIGPPQDNAFTFFFFSFPTALDTTGIEP
jgi:hypothetical protein